MFFYKSIANAEVANMLYGFLFSVFIGGFIGYITNLIAVKALFHPREKYNLILFEYQGLMPKRHQDLASSIGDLVAEELINIEALLQTLKPEDLDPVIKGLAKKIRENIETNIQAAIAKIPAFSAKTGLAKIMDTVEGQAYCMIKQHVPDIMEGVSKDIAKSVSIRDIVTTKIANMDIAQVEKLFDRIANKEMNAIVWIGGILGMIVGAIQFVAQRYWLVDFI